VGKSGEKIKNSTEELEIGLGDLIPMLKTHNLKSQTTVSRRMDTILQSNFFS
jgi:hypothetical protein